MKGKAMKQSLLTLLILAVLVMTSCSRPVGTTASDKRSYARNMRQETISELYEKKPETKAKIGNAAGYGVFSNVNINLFLLSSGNGYGIVRDQATGKDTYMRMQMLGVGFGAGVKDFRAVIVFNSKEALHTFTEKGWEWGGHADAAAVSDDKGAEAGVAGEVTGDMEIYNFTEAGIALQATVAGTKYWKDKELN
jgi:lipid-binding SYLF domain-containing protein